MTRAERCRAAGRCISCVNPADPGKSRCSACREKNLVGQKKRDERRSARRKKQRDQKRLYRCGVCEKVGHRRETCPEIDDARCPDWDDGKRCPRKGSHPFGARLYCRRHWRANRAFLRQHRAA